MRGRLDFGLELVRVEDLRSDGWMDGVCIWLVVGGCWVVRNSMVSLFREGSRFLFPGFTWCTFSLRHFFFLRFLLFRFSSFSYTQFLKRKLELLYATHHVRLSSTRTVVLPRPRLLVWILLLFDFSTSEFPLVYYSRSPCVLSYSSL